MKINFFSMASPLFPFRWFIIISLAVSSFMIIADQVGWRLFSFSNQQQWNASGPGGGSRFHK